MDTPKNAMNTAAPKLIIRPRSFGFFTLLPRASPEFYFSFSSSYSIYCIAITTTPVKHITIPRISSGITGSRSKKNATIEIQKGVVCLKTMIRASGARGAAVFIRMKFIWPVSVQTVKYPFLSHGNIVLGLFPRKAHQKIAMNSARKFLIKLKSPGWKP